MRFCDKLPKLRKDNNLSQEQLAERLNVSRQAVSKWESGASYPDMEKFLQMCKILNCTLEDLMDDGSVNPENETKPKKANITDYLNSFLSVITRTYNMLCSMNWKSRIICILETFFIAVLIYLARNFLNTASESLIYSVFSILPYPFDLYTIRVLSKLCMLLFTILGVITFLHLFKVRYLDYYVTIEDATVHEKIIEEEIDDVRIYGKDSVGKPKNAKIIIRDPKHSTESFFQALGKIFVFLLKAIVVICAIPAAIGLMLGAFGTCMMIYNAFCSITFAWTAFAFAGFVLLCYTLLHLAYNYIFKREQPYKIFLIFLISGLLMIGCGLGVFMADILSFEEIPSMENIELQSQRVIIDEITEQSSISAFTENINYIIDDNIEGVEITAIYPIEIKLLENGYDNRVYLVPVYEHDFISLYKIFTNDIQNKQIRNSYQEYDMLQLTVKLSQASYDMMYSYDGTY